MGVSRQRDNLGMNQVPRESFDQFLGNYPLQNKLSGNQIMASGSDYESN